MLDLSIIDNTPLFEIKLLDGRELHLKRPTQSLYTFLANLSDNAANLSDTQSLEFVFNAFTRILNRNTEGITFTVEELDEYGPEIVMFVINQYFTYWDKDTASKVDFQ